MSEKAYAIDRMLTHMKLAGLFKKCRGIVFGSMSGPDSKREYENTVKRVFSDCDFPIMMGLNAGHCKNKLSLPLNVKAEMNTKTKSITFLESALR